VDEAEDLLDELAELLPDGVRLSWGAVPGMPADVRKALGAAGTPFYLDAEFQAPDGEPLVARFQCTLRPADVGHAVSLAEIGGDPPRPVPYAEAAGGDAEALAADMVRSLDEWAADRAEDDDA
jgi:hypothetical protein